MKRDGTKIMLQGPFNLLNEQSLRIVFKASSNQAEYEAVIAEMTLSLEMGTSTLKDKSDSQSVAK